MNGDIGRWNQGLLFAALGVVLGIIGVVSARCVSERGLARGLLMQGVLLTYVFGAAFFQGTGELKLGGLAIVGLLVIQSACGPGFTAHEQPMNEDDGS